MPEAGPDLHVLLEAAVPASEAVSRLQWGQQVGEPLVASAWQPHEYNTVYILSAYCNSLDRIVGTVGNIATFDKYSFSSLPVEFSSLITSFDVTDTSDSVLRWTVLVLTGIFCLNLYCVPTHRWTSWPISWTWWTSSSWWHSPSWRGTAGCSCGAASQSAEGSGNIYIQCQVPHQTRHVSNVW